MAHTAKAGQHMIENRRKADSVYREMDAMIANDRKVNLMANFEIKTSQKIDQRMKQVSDIDVDI